MTITTLENTAECFIFEQRTHLLLTFLQNIFAFSCVKSTGVRYLRFSLLLFRSLIELEHRVVCDDLLISILRVDFHFYDIIEYHGASLRHVV